MPYIEPAAARRFDMHGATFTALAAPSSGAVRNAAWMVRIEHGEPGVVHRLSDEETFVCLGGRAIAQVGDARHELSAGGALIVPPDTEFALTKVGEEPFQAVVVLPVGATARVGAAAPFTPPWAV